MRNLLSLALLGALLFAGSVQAALTRPMGTDPTAVSVPAEVSCNLYRGAALVVNTPVVATAGKVQCLFPSVTLNPGESYTATYVNATGFEGAASLPFATGSAPGRPINLAPQ